MHRKEKVCDRAFGQSTHLSTNINADECRMTNDEFRMSNGVTRKHTLQRNRLWTLAVGHSAFITMQSCFSLPTRQAGPWLMSALDPGL
jgi:hypothetical protein